MRPSVKRKRGKDTVEQLRSRNEGQRNLRGTQHRREKKRCVQEWMRKKKIDRNRPDSKKLENKIQRCTG